MTNIVDFKPQPPDTLVQSLTAFLPEGEFWRAKNIEGSNLNRVITALSRVFGRLEADIYVLASQFIPSFYNLQDILSGDVKENVNSFIPLWEQFVGIPDKCFSVARTNEDRIRNVIIKLGWLNLNSKQDYYNLAYILGVSIISFDNSVPDEITIHVTGGSPLNQFPMLYDPLIAPEGAFIFGSVDLELYSCLVECYRPAMVEMIVIGS